MILWLGYKRPRVPPASRLSLYWFLGLHTLMESYTMLEKPTRQGTEEATGQLRGKKWGHQSNNFWETEFCKQHQRAWKQILHQLSLQMKSFLDDTLISVLWEILRQRTQLSHIQITDCGRQNMPPLNVHILIPKACEYVLLRGKGKLRRQLEFSLVVS